MPASYGRFAAGAVVLFYSISAQAEIFNCDGQWTNRPCQGSITHTLKETEYIPDAAPLPPPGGDPAQQQQQQPSSYQNLQMRRRSRTRSPVDLKYVNENVDFRRWRFRGSVRGAGPAKAMLTYIYRDRWGNITSKSNAKVVTMKLPDEGGEQAFEFTVDKPTPNAIAEYVFTAEYTGRWQGYLNLTGCCNEGVRPSCSVTGDVSCSDGTKSGACQCGD